MVWALQDAKSKFSAVAEKAWQGEPQVVTRRGKPLVVVISYETFEKKVERQGKGSFVDFLRSCPEDLSEIIGERENGPARAHEAVFE